MINGDQATRAAIFDLDGTLLDTLGDLGDGANFILEREGYPIHSIESYKEFIGGGFRELIRRALPVEHESRAESLFMEAKDYYRENIAVKTKPYDGILQVIETLQQKGWKLAVCSNKPDDLTQILIRHFFPEKFQVVLGQSDRFPKKPAADMALWISQALGVHPRDTLFIGDSGVDVKTAAAAEMQGIAVLWGFRSKEELLEAGAKKMVQHPIELLQWVME